MYTGVSKTGRFHQRLIARLLVVAYLVSYLLPMHAHILCSNSAKETHQHNASVRFNYFESGHQHTSLTHSHTTQHAEQHFNDVYQHADSHRYGDNHQHSGTHQHGDGEVVVDLSPKDTIKTAGLDIAGLFLVVFIFMALLLVRSKVWFLQIVDPVKKPCRFDVYPSKQAPPYLPTA